MNAEMAGARGRLINVASFHVRGLSCVVEHGPAWGESPPRCSWFRGPDPGPDSVERGGQGRTLSRQHGATSGRRGGGWGRPPVSSPPPTAPSPRTGSAPPRAPSALSPRRSASLSAGVDARTEARRSPPGFRMTCRPPLSPTALETGSEPRGRWVIERVGPHPAWNQTPRGGSRCPAFWKEPCALGDQHPRPLPTPFPGGRMGPRP